AVAPEAESAAASRRPPGRRKREEFITGLSATPGGRASASRGHAPVAAAMTPPAPAALARLPRPAFTAGRVRVGLPAQPVEVHPGPDDEVLRVAFRFHPAEAHLHDVHVAAELRPVGVLGPIAGGYDPSEHARPNHLHGARGSDLVAETPLARREDL